MLNKLLVVIGGPTGIGKTDLAIRLALHFQTEIVNADSRQIYKELNVGVGRPSFEQMTTVPHHLIGHVSIVDHYSAGHYVKDAMKVIEQLFLDHEVIILTGGTGLYIKGIMEGFDDIPDVPTVVTEHWTNVWKAHGTAFLLESLKKFDPEYLLTVDHSNPVRLIRALAVSDSSGQPYSSFRKGSQQSRPFRILPIVLKRPREELYARIDQRVTDMLASGWLEEAKALYPHRHLKALQTVGYKEMFEYIDEKITLPEAISAIRQSTRRLAKRQMTWWRHQGVWKEFSPDDYQSIINAIQDKG